MSRGGAHYGGIPIGNLTSQIFANIYLNEFDRYVRHSLKPLAYIRYGDDCTVFAKTRHQAHEIRRNAIEYLHKKLKLTVNPKNDLVVRVDQGLHFLGHVITDKRVFVDRHTTRQALDRVNTRNLASYKSLKIIKWPKRQLSWLVLDEIDEILQG